MELKKELNSNQHEKIKLSIVNNFGGKVFYSERNKAEIYFHKNFSDIDTKVGFAYTSSSDYAGYWACNDNISKDVTSSHRLVGIVMGINEEIYSLWWDKNENEKYELMY